MEVSVRTLQLTLEEAIDICKILGNDSRMHIIRALSEGPMNVNELSKKLGTPFSTTAVNIKKLEEAELISTEIIPGRGSQKVNSKRYDQIIINLSEKKPTDDNIISFEMPIGEFVHSNVEPTCGLLSESGIIHLQDEPRSFYEPERKQAQMVWFKAGFIEYQFPNRIPYGSKIEYVNFSAEMCSEAPYYKLDWPSDITCWINGVEIGTWTSPGDFDGERGYITPSWWGTNNTQYGLLKNWNVSQSGSFIDGIQISSVTVDDLRLLDKPYISLKLGIKDNAINKGGMNLFGSKFGNYEQDIIMKLKHS